MARSTPPTTTVNHRCPFHQWTKVRQLAPDHQETTVSREVKARNPTTEGSRFDVEHSKGAVEQ